MRAVFAYAMLGLFAGFVAFSVGTAARHEITKTFDNLNARLDQALRLPR